MDHRARPTGPNRGDRRWTLDRRAFLAGSAATGALLIAGCSGADDPGGDTPAVDGSAGAALEPAERISLRLPGAAFGFPSPFAYQAGLGYYQMSLVYDTLLWKDASGELLPWLAESFDAAPDGSSFEFTLREGVTWHDGRPVTVDDVMFTFDYYQSLTLPFLVIAQPVFVADVTATGASTVEITLDQPAVTFPDVVAGALPIVPRHVWEDVDDPAAAQDVSLLIGSGPYVVDSYSAADGALAYAANDEFFLGAPFVERIELVPTGDELTALLAGEVVATGPTLVSVRPEALAPFTSDDAYAIAEQPAGFTYPLYWNLGRGGALADVRVRQACAHAIDRADVAQRLLGDNGVPGNPGFVPPDNPFHVAVEQYDFDADRAGQLLDEAGYVLSSGEEVRQDADGHALRFELLFPNDQTPLAELVVNGLTAVGIDIATRPVELGPALFGAKLGGDFDLALTLYPGPGGVPPSGDPDYLRQIFSSSVPPGTATATGYANPELDDLADRQLVTQDVDARKEIIGRMQEIIAEDIPVLPLYYAGLRQVYRRDVLDQWYFTPGGFPVSAYNKQLFVTGLKTGTEVRPTR